MDQSGNKNPNLKETVQGWKDIHNIMYDQRSMTFNNDFPLPDLELLRQPPTVSIIEPVVQPEIVANDIVIQPKKKQYWGWLVGLVVLMIIGGWLLRSQPQGPWSPWTDVLPGTVSKQTHQIEQHMIYRLRNKETILSSNDLDGWIKDDTIPLQWGAWSPWGTNQLIGSDQMEVEQQEVEDVGKTKMVHRYTRWMYINIKDQWFSSYTDYQGEFYQRNGRWEVIELDEPLLSKGFYDEKEHFGSYCFGPSGCSWSNWWWNYSTVEVTLPVGKHLEYRYRMLSATYYRWLAWSNWTDEEIIATKDQDVQSVQGYRYRLK
jgi:hypothetical protein